MFSHTIRVSAVKHRWFAALDVVGAITANAFCQFVLQ